MSKCTAPVRGHRTAAATNVLHVVAATMVTATIETVVGITLEHLVIR